MLNSMELRIDVMLLPDRIRSVSEFCFDDKQEDAVARTHGIRFTVRDMGNGVLRCERPFLDPLGYILKDAERHGRYRMEDNFPEWMLDMVDAAVRTVGVDPCPPAHRVPSVAYARPMRDGLIQILGWRHPAFFR